MLGNRGVSICQFSRILTNKIKFTKKISMILLFLSPVGNRHYKKKKTVRIDYMNLLMPGDLMYFCFNMVHLCISSWIG